MARTTGGLALEVDGFTDTLKAVQGLERDLRSQTNRDLRHAARECATRLAVKLTAAAESSGVPVAPRVARSIKVRSDRIPALYIGGGKKVGTGKRGHAGALVWGSEQGPKSDPNRFGVPSKSAGYWIAPTVAAFSSSDALTAYRRAVYEILHARKLV